MGWRQDTAVLALIWSVVDLWLEALLAILSMPPGPVVSTEEGAWLAGVGGVFLAVFVAPPVGGMVSSAFPHCRVGLVLATVVFGGLGILGVVAIIWVYITHNESPGSGVVALVLGPILTALFPVLIRWGMQYVRLPHPWEDQGE